jgi:hypothetical protein
VVNRRAGRGRTSPGGAREKAAAQEDSLFNLYLWQGRTLWGMMLLDEQCLLDYLETRPEVEKRRIAATGMRTVKVAPDVAGSGIRGSCPSGCTPR